VKTLIKPPVLLNPSSFGTASRQPLSGRGKPQESVPKPV
jgi:hypothetical protein